MGVGQFLSDLYGATLGTIAGTRAAETRMGDAGKRLEELLSTLDTWSVESVARVLVVADPLTLVGRDDVAELYLGIAVTIVERATAVKDCSSRTLRKALEAGIDRLPADAHVFIKRGALRMVPACLARLAERSGCP